MHLYFLICLFIKCSLNSIILLFLGTMNRTLDSYQSMTNDALLLFLSNLIHNPISFTKCFVYKSNSYSFLSISN